MKVKVSFHSYMFETRGLVKLGRLSGEDLYLYTWWTRLATKLGVYGIMNVVKNMSTDANR